MFEKFDASSTPLDQDLFEDWVDTAIHEADTATRLVKRLREQAKKDGKLRNEINNNIGSNIGSGVLPALDLNASEVRLLLGEPEV
jgi:hypothetical protein